MGDTPRRYGGQQIEVSFDTRRCIHAEECVHGLPAVFENGRRPWIMADAAPADAVAAVIARCPSGALRYRRLDGGPEEQPQAGATVDVTPGGPLYVRGAVQFLAADGAVIAEGPRMALCRCGQSHNKPFCDNSHRAAGFADRATVVAGGEPTDGPLTITASANGPLLLRGPFTISGADGAARHTESAALCRCGGSGSKPFCDGTHRRIGFLAQEASSGE